MLLSKACIYGVRAALFMASQPSDEYISIKEMSNKLGISFHFLTKILQQLTAEGIMHSYKGPKGGIKLASPINNITLQKIVEAIDGPELLTECVLGLPECGKAKPCPLHDSWAKTREGIRRMLSETDLEKLALDLADNNYRLAT